MYKWQNTTYCIFHIISYYIFEGLVVDFIYVVIESRIHSPADMYICTKVVVYNYLYIKFSRILVNIKNIWCYMITTGRQSRNSFWRRISYLRAFYFYFQSPLMMQHTWRETQRLCKPVNSFCVFYLGQSEYASGRIKFIQFQRILWIRRIGLYSY